MNDPGDDITVLLRRIREGDSGAESDLVQAVYDPLHRLAAVHMRSERSDHTLQTTALVNEAYMRLISQNDVDWQDRLHFFRAAAQVMRRVLIDHARTHLAAKRGSGLSSVPLDDAAAACAQRPEELIALDVALDQLAQKDARAAKVIEFRYFGGLSVAETSMLLGISERTVKREWSFGRAWLRAHLRGRKN